MGVVGLAENIATQPSLTGAWAELRSTICMVLCIPTEILGMHAATCDRAVLGFLHKEDF